MKCFLVLSDLRRSNIPLQAQLAFPSTAGQLDAQVQVTRTQGVSLCRTVSTMGSREQPPQGTGLLGQCVKPHTVSTGGLDGCPGLQARAVLFSC